jgi:hypothetical protein
MIIPYRTIFVSPVNVSNHSNPRKKKLTENSSTNPQTRNAHANTTTESVNPALPSNVLGVVGDHLYRPTRLPITEACTLRIQSTLLLSAALKNSPRHLQPQPSKYPCTSADGKACKRDIFSQ